MQNKKEQEIYKELVAFLKSRNQQNPKENAKRFLNAQGGFVDRFNYFTPLISKKAKECILISGCNVGSEMIVAKQFGFKKIYGVEVAKEYARLAKKRLLQDSSYQIDHYDGMKLPYQSDFFSMICSGHVIEHTWSPVDYIQELMRVLKKNGYLYIEFPNRYNLKELHTNLFSLEWLPLPIRNLVLKILIIKFPQYEKVLKTLKPISISAVKRHCNKFPYACEVVDVTIPRRGFVRMVLKKTK